jgi:2-C-methyl-D-erythritol 4-phosphate cytidylyltransferase
MTNALIFAGGSGTRMNSRGRPKQFLQFYGKELIIHTLENFQNHPQVDGIVVVCIEDWIPYLQKLLDKFGIDKVRSVVPGGASGQESIYNGLCAIQKFAPADSIVLVHDGVRPFVNESLISDCIKCVKEHGSAITVSDLKGSQTATIKYRTASSGEYTLTSPPTRSAAGSQTVYWQVTAPNHATQTGSYTLTITSLVAVLSWGETTWTYDGQGHSTTCIVSNLIPGDTCNVILGNNSITNIGSETVTAIALSNTNYELPTDSTVSITITITHGLFIKLSGVWTPVKEVYKRVSGSWVKQDMTTAFSTSESYVKKD